VPRRRAIHDSGVQFVFSSEDIGAWTCLDTHERKGNQMNKRIAAVAAVVTLSATLAFAGPGEGRGHGRHGKGGFGAKFAQELNLTADQQRLIADIRKNSEAQHREFFESSKATWKEARAARKAGDTAKLESLRPRLDAQREQMKQIRASEETQILSVLTAEQKAKYETLKAERKARHGRGHGERKPRT
jgi:protein CpxP